MANRAYKELMEREKEFSASYRWQHWIRAFSIVALVVTGFYIAVPFITPEPNSEPTNFLQAYMRGWHEIIGWILIAAFFYKTYLFLFTREHRSEMASFRDLVDTKVWAQQIGYYLFITKHPKLNGTYNPIQFVAYIGFYVMLIGIILTGLVLYVHTTHVGLGAVLYEPMRSLEAMMGGLANVREIHHILMWGIMIFVVAHIYMAVFNSVYGKEGAMDAVFSGMKLKHEDH
jgi:Ni/Fe-hydrogenase 1 B-type cytochrome subunit